MTSHLERLAALAAPLADSAVASPEFERALRSRLRTAALGLTAGTGDRFELWKACSDSGDDGASMADAMIDDMPDEQRDRITQALGTELARHVQIASVAFVAGQCEATSDAAGADLDDVDLATLVAIANGLQAVVA